ncbi:hypothetical protein [Meiothermus hypogaeus]|uniref:Uncharacterized protein n=2 Tax=Meiothermus hypogaeus TaxID=884155 RepID=A0A511R2G1_9DEIN|nr:hypothetical protein [Meiothermus hypogaeus]RIH74886.1 hypothetical protein Mhypo_03144 [Meiothermus hypogaeus]GEM83793.1 hypothetical protein MHY01S_19590 [Meiothermus hypogaeus NBRC 106114]GIW36239.1 MAG: hypothetical protein KatS3mg073_0384 [Meiothermus sp.]
MRGRRWLIYATGLLWLPLVMAGGSLLLTRAVAAPLFIAYLSLFCLVVSLVLFWMGIAGLLRRRLRVADLLWLGLYGVGALLYTQLTGVLRP